MTKDFSVGATGYVKEFCDFLEGWQGEFNSVAAKKIVFKKGAPNQEYFYRLKKLKLMYTYKIYESLIIINCDEKTIFDNNKGRQKDYQQIDNVFLLIKDQFLLIITMNVTILFILGIITKDFATVFI